MLSPTYSPTISSLLSLCSYGGRWPGWACKASGMQSQWQKVKILSSMVHFSKILLGPRIRPYEHEEQQPQLFLQPGPRTCDLIKWYRETLSSRERKANLMQKIHRRTETLLVFEPVQRCQVRSRRFFQLEVLISIKTRTPTAHPLQF